MPRQGRWPDSRRYLDYAALAARYDRHPATVRRWVERGSFPAPTYITPSCPVWPVEVIEAFEAERAEREAA